MIVERGQVHLVQEHHAVVKLKISLHSNHEFKFECDVRVVQVVDVTAGLLAPQSLFT